MSTFKLVISSPDGNVFSGEAGSISVRGSDGDLMIMAGHIPFVTAVKPCECKLVLEDGTERTGKTDGGILSVAEDKTTLLSSSFEWQTSEDDK